MPRYGSKQIATQRERLKVFIELRHEISVISRYATEMIKTLLSMPSITSHIVVESNERSYLKGYLLSYKVFPNVLGSTVVQQWK